RRRAGRVAGSALIRLAGEDAGAVHDQVGEVDLPVVADYYVLGEADRAEQRRAAVAGRTVAPLARARDIDHAAERVDERDPVVLHRSDDDVPVAVLGDAAVLVEACIQRGTSPAAEGRLGAQGPAGHTRENTYRDAEHALRARLAHQ